MPGTVTLHRLIAAPDFTDFHETADHDCLIMYEDTRQGIVRVGSDGKIH